MNKNKPDQVVADKLTNELFKLSEKFPEISFNILKYIYIKGINDGINLNWNVSDTECHVRNISNSE